MWIKLSENIPPISYLESDNSSDPYECYAVLVFCEEKPGIQCVAYLCKEQDKDNWDFGDLYWELYIPKYGGSGDIIDVDFCTFSH